MNLIYEPWPWYVAGPLIGFTFLLLLRYGQTLGISSSFRTACSAAGAGKFVEFFRWNWKGQGWNITFILGAILGGFIAHQYMTDGEAIAISQATWNDLAKLGIQENQTGLAPADIFNWENLMTWQGFVFIVLGGFLVGFGTRYAGGCTSGHAISGLSNLQWPSLVAVIGFFIGGLTMTHLIFPFLF